MKSDIVKRRSWQPSVMVLHEDRPSFDEPQQRFSAPMLERTSMSSFSGDTPLSKTTTANVVGVIADGDHCAFEVEVDTGSERFHVRKRFSEFRTFRANVLKCALPQGARCGTGPCRHVSRIEHVQFPRRKLQLIKSCNLQLAQERSAQLQSFLHHLLGVYRESSRRHIRTCVTKECALFKMIIEFLGISAPLEQPNPSEDSGASSTGSPSCLESSATAESPAPRQPVVARLSFKMQPVPDQVNGTSKPSPGA